MMVGMALQVNEHPALAGIEVGQDFAHAIGKLADGVDELFAAGFTPPTARSARLYLEAIEQQSRRLDAMRIEALDALDTSGHHRRDGHHSAKVMVRHVGSLSGGTALRMDRSARALREMPVLRAAFQAGEVSADQVGVLALGFANPRVREHIVALDQFFTDTARDPTVDFRAFETLVRDFVDRVDEDGTLARHQRQHANRDAKFVNDFDGSWHLSGGCGPNDGAEFHEIWQRFIDEQFQADVAEARQRLGRSDDQSVLGAELARTPQQRRWDALLDMARRAASTLPGQSGSRVVTNYMIDHTTFERWAAKLAGAEVAPDDPFRPDRRCETLDGHPIDPAAAVAAALIGDIRRTIVDAKGVVINLSRRSRIYRNHAALAARMTATMCSWPGCWHPVTACQIDHMIPWADHGDTEQDNACPCCGHHNRLRNQGYRIERLDDGTIAVYHPDGTRIT